MCIRDRQEEMVLEFLSTPHDDPQPEENEPETKEAEYEETAEKEETKESSAKKESAKDSVTDNISTSPMFQMYLEELKDIPEYTKEQQIDMYKKLLAGEESMVHALSNAWLRNVLEVAKKLAVSPEEMCIRDRYCNHPLISGAVTAGNCRIVAEIRKTLSEPVPPDLK